jgi:hypothetical protein
MLTTNSRNDKLAAARIDFSTCGMLDGTCLGKALKDLHDTLEDNDNDNDDTEVDPGDGDKGQTLGADPHLPSR